MKECKKIEVLFKKVVSFKKDNNSVTAGDMSHTYTKRSNRTQLVLIAGTQAQD